jgi:putative hydrolase of the HAD superfamily
MTAIAFAYFDLGNVLLHFDHAVGMRKLAKVTGKDPEFLFDLVMNSGLEDRYEMGLMTSREFADAINAACETNCSMVRILDAISDMFSPNQPILSVLESLHDNGTRLGLLSNTCEAHWQWILRQKYPMIADWFDPVVLSFEIHAMKPQPEVYRHATRVAGVSAEQIFFTDDRADNIAAARNVGWKAHQFRDTETLVQELSSLLPLKSKAMG